MNDQKVCKMAKNVNYAKPEVEMVELEIEGSLLTTGSGPIFGGGGGKPELEGPEDGGGGDFRSSRPRVKR